MKSETGFTFYIKSIKKALRVDIIPELSQVGVLFKILGFRLVAGIHTKLKHPNSRISKCRKHMCSLRALLV